jgi:peroxin-6
MHNIVGAFSAEMPRVHLQPSPFGSREPAIPTAKSVTLARIASPFSTHSAYEDIFLQGLKNHFQSQRRLMKEGDIIPIVINTQFALGNIQEGGELQDSDKRSE